MIRKLSFIALMLVALPCMSQSGVLRKNLDSTGTTYIKGSIRTQMWARYMETNPGTLVGNKPHDHVFDMSMRRLRIMTMAQLTPKLFVFVLFGGNNLDQKSGQKFVTDMLDFNMEYEFDKAFAFGLGKHAWDGISRWSVRSSKSLMSLDAPIFSLFSVNKNDYLARTLGFWAKGQIGKLDYKVSYRQPRLFSEPIKEGVASYAEGNIMPRIGGYAKWQFWDMESNKTAYSGGAGTLLGKKRIMNIGAGFSNQKEMMWATQNGENKYYDYFTWAAEWFMDTPIGAGGDAMTAYLGYFDSDFGPNYVRSLGANGISTLAKDSKSLSHGTAYPMMGTGQTIFTQVGYLFGTPVLGTGKFQPYVGMQHSTFEGLADPSVIFHTGFNIYFKGHSNKLTLGLENRPVFQKGVNGGKPFTNSRANMVVLQYQIEIN